MYELGYRTRKRHYKFIGAIICLLIVAGCIAAYKALHLTAAPHSQIQNGSSHVTDYQPGVVNRMQINKPQFTLSLPTGWSESTSQDLAQPTPTYNFHSPSADARQLAVYIDNTPPNLAINRALTVSAKGAELNYGTVSDNCVSYTQPSDAEKTAGRAIGLWQGASFICDIGNYERDVVGTVSTDGVNYVAMTSPTTGRHQLFFTYTDNGPNPDFNVFYAILDSFTLK